MSWKAVENSKISEKFHQKQTLLKPKMSMKHLEETKIILEKSIFQLK